jgi:osmotically-inducible protein OsmY
MKTDLDLQRDVQDELAWEPSVQAQHIGVSVKDGVVTLDGNVPTYAEKFAAENAVKRVGGWIALSGEVDWNYQRVAAHEAVRHLMGVKNVTNLIKVKAPAASTVENDLQVTY